MSLVSHRRYSGGFTLIELLVVLLILGLIAGLAGPQVMNYLGESKAKAAKLQIEEFGSSLDLFKLDVGRYPDTQEGLQALVQKPSGPNSDRWRGPYMKKKAIPKDPWNVDFQYASPGQNGHYDIVSFGADGRAGGDGDNKDIVSWD
jgi:general secretion pathway protein G